MQPSEIWQAWDKRIALKYRHLFYLLSICLFRSKCQNARSWTTVIAEMTWSSLDQILCWSWTKVGQISDLARESLDRTRLLGISFACNIVPLLVYREESHSKGPYIDQLRIPSLPVWSVPNQSLRYYCSCEISSLANAISAVQSSHGRVNGNSSNRTWDSRHIHIGFFSFKQPLHFV